MSLGQASSGTWATRLSRWPADTSAQSNAGALVGHTGLLLRSGRHASQDETQEKSCSPVQRQPAEGTQVQPHPHSCGTCTSTLPRATPAHGRASHTLQEDQDPRATLEKPQFSQES